MAGENTEVTPEDNVLHISALMHVAVANFFSALNVMSKDAYSKQLMAEVYDGVN